MRHLIAILVLCSLTFGCATSATNTLDTSRTKQKTYMVIRAPSTVLGDVDPSQFRIVLRVHTWRDNATSFQQSYAAYCDVRDDYLECLAPVDYPNTEFELQAVWLQPNPATLTPEQKADLKAAWEDHPGKFWPKKLCDAVNVGVSVGHFGWNGGDASADRWMEVNAKREPFCRYQVPRNFVVGSRK